MVNGTTTVPILRHGVMGSDELLWQEQVWKWLCCCAGPFLHSTASPLSASTPQSSIRATSTPAALSAPANIRHVSHITQSFFHPVQAHGVFWRGDVIRSRIRAALQSGASWWQVECRLCTREELAPWENRKGMGRAASSELFMCLLEAGSRNGRLWQVQEGTER